MLTVDELFKKGCQEFAKEFLIPTKLIINIKRIIAISILRGSRVENSFEESCHQVETFK